MPVEIAGGSALNWRYFSLSIPQVQDSMRLLQIVLRLMLNIKAYLAPMSPPPSVIQKSLPQDASAAVTFGLWPPIRQLINIYYQSSTGQRTASGESECPISSNNYAGYVDGFQTYFIILGVIHYAICILMRVNNNLRWITRFQT